MQIRSDYDVIMPYQVVVSGEMVDISARFEQAVEKPAAVGGRVVIVGGPNAGEVGEILKVMNGSLEIAIVASRDPFLRRAHEEEDGEEREWIPAEEFCEQFGMKMKVLKHALALLPKKSVRPAGKSVEVHQKSVPRLMEIVSSKHRAPKGKGKGKEKGKNNDKEKSRAPKVDHLIDYFTETEKKLNSKSFREFPGDVVVEPMANVIWRGKPINVVIPVEPGDRVVSVADTDLVPFGTKGTVAEIHPNLCECLVIADTIIPFGTTHGNRLKTKRGFTAKFGDIIKIRSAID